MQLDFYFLIFNKSTCFLDHFLINMAAEMIPTIPPDHKNKEINKEQEIFVESVLSN